jgi:hypothetical protein
MIFRSELRWKPEINLCEMEAPQTYKDKRDDVDEKFSDIEMHVVTPNSNGTWRPVTKQSNKG